MSDPNFQNIDVARVRETTLGSLCDVRFSFSDPKTGDKTEVLAHKFVLALGSEVFMAQFYGSMKEKKDVIPIEDSSVEAFRIFLDIVYNKRISLDCFDFKLQAELFYLGEKYRLNHLQESILKAISDRKMISGNLLEAAKVAQEYSHLEKFSDTVHKICSRFVRNNFEDVLNTFKGTEMNDENSSALHRIMARAAVCPNCKHDPCQDQVYVTEDNFIVDALILYEYDSEGNMGPRKTVRMEGSTLHYKRLTDNASLSHDLDKTPNLLRYNCLE